MRRYEAKSGRVDDSCVRTSLKSQISYGIQLEGAQPCVRSSRSERDLLLHLEKRILLVRRGHHLEGCGMRVISVGAFNTGEYNTAG